MNGKLNTSGFTAGGGSVRASGRGRTTMVEAMDKRVCRSAAAGATLDFKPITPPIEVNGALEGVQVHSLCSMKSSNLTFNYRLGYSYDGLGWDGGTNIFTSSMTSVGHDISDWVSNADEQGRYIRLELGLADTGSVEEGTISASLVLKFWGQ